MTCNDLTFLCVTKGERQTYQMLGVMYLNSQALGARMLIAADDCSLPELTGRPGLTITNVKSRGYIESVLDVALAAVQTPYVLRLDDDERLSPGMLDWLASGAYRTADHWKFPRAHLFGSPDLFLMVPPLWPDHQTRLSIREKAGGRKRIHDGSPYGGGKLAPCYIEHWKFLVRDVVERREINDRYERLQRGAGEHFRLFSVPEEVIPDIDRARYKADLAQRWAVVDARQEEIPEIVSLGCASGAFQHKDEMVDFCSWMIEKLDGKLHHVLEIGTLHGGTARIWHALSAGKVISVDLPDGKFGGKDHGYSESRADARNAALQRELPRFRGILGNSHEPETTQRVVETLSACRGPHKRAYMPARLRGGWLREQSDEAMIPVLHFSPVDLLFIDGDHSMDGVSRDYEIYSHLVRSGGIIAFHDVSETPLHRAVGCAVPAFFASLPAREKYVFSGQHEWGGIGAIIKP